MVDFINIKILNFHSIKYYVKRIRQTNDWKIILEEDIFEKLYTGLIKENGQANFKDKHKAFYQRTYRDFKCASEKMFNIYIGH